MRPQKFHGRYETDERECAAPGCDELSEYRSPGSRAPSFDGPGDWRWFCLEHIREFNSDYDWFEGVMRTPDHIDEQAGSGPAATNELMPPDRCPSVAGGKIDSDCMKPTLEERKMLAEWIACEKQRPHDFYDAGVDAAPDAEADAP